MPLTSLNISIYQHRHQAGLAAYHSCTPSLCLLCARAIGIKGWVRHNSLKEGSERGHSLIEEVRKAHSGRKDKISYKSEVNAKHCGSSKVGEARTEKTQQVPLKEVTSDMSSKAK